MTDAPNDLHELFGVPKGNIIETLTPESFIAHLPDQVEVLSAQYSTIQLTLGATVVKVLSEALATGMQTNGALPRDPNAYLSFPEKLRMQSQFQSHITLILSPEMARAVAADLRAGLSDTAGARPAETSE